jgi:hypothetical protein
MARRVAGTASPADAVVVRGGHGTDGDPFVSRTGLPVLSGAPVTPRGSYGSPKPTTRILPVRQTTKPFDNHPTAHTRWSDA